MAGNGKPKGSEKSGGRAKGTLNKTTKKTRELVTDFMDEKFSDVTLAWEGLAPVDKVKTYISLVKYIMPTLTSVKVEENNGDEVLKRFLDNQK
jgi:hypothetical protein